MFEWEKVLLDEFLMSLQQVNLVFDRNDEWTLGVDNTDYFSTKSAYQIMERQVTQVQNHPNTASGIFKMLCTFRGSSIFMADASG